MPIVGSFTTSLSPAAKKGAAEAGKRRPDCEANTAPQTKENKIKLGFNFVKDYQVPSKNDVIDSIEKMNHVIWSDQFVLSN